MTTRSNDVMATLGQAQAEAERLIRRLREYQADLSEANCGIDPALRVQGETAAHDAVAAATGLLTQLQIELEHCAGADIVGDMREGRGGGDE